MKLAFSKYHGTGNDFIIADDRADKIRLSPEHIKQLCDRHFGIGGDGLILIRKHKVSDFEMLYYNSDGQTGSMCGNGGRCAVAFANKNHIGSSKPTFSAFDGLHEAELLSTEPPVVKLKMQDVHKIEINDDFIFLNTGSPHYVCFADDVAAINVVEEGKKIRNSNRFAAEGTNVNFVRITDEGLQMRTYERGVENETLSCGTGVVAAVLASVVSKRLADTGIWAVSTPGGVLKVHYKKENNTFTDVFLEGPAMEVFSGSIELENK
jgi:diaminopimelate epimerase